MILDGHIHINSTHSKPDEMLERMKTAGIDGGLLISAMPDNMDENAADYKERIDHVISCAKGHSHLFPFFFINPVCEDAIEQIDYAIEKGIRGFKVICNKFYPNDPRCLEAIDYIAKNNKPILFHSGILWDGKNSSGKYNKPVEFECMLSIDNIKFSLAHVSWPWCDENLAVFGKFINAKKNYISSEMFIDITPGTPEIYRYDVLYKLFNIGYDIENNVIFGLDNCMEDYNVEWAQKWINIDNDIYNKLGISNDIIDKVYSKNLLRFIHMEEV